MRKRLMLSALLLLVVLLFSACGKMSDEEAIAAMKESDELWIAHGLAAWEAGAKPEDISYIFDDGNSVCYLYLHDYMFTYDEEMSILAAEQFFRFVAEEHGLAAILDTDMRVTYKTEYLHSLGFEFDYPLSDGVEKFFRELTFHSDDRFDYIFTHKKSSFTFTDLEVLRPTDMQSMIYDTCTFLDEFASFIKKKDLSFYFDTNRRVVFHCENIGRTTTVSHTSNSGVIYMRSRWSLPHEYVHAVANFTDGTTGANLMLSEVFADYFPNDLGLTDMFKKQNYIRFKAAETGYYEDCIAQGGAAAEEGKYFNSIWKNYVALGGKYEPADDIDHFIFNQACLITGRTSGSSICITLYETYQPLRTNLQPFDGSDLLTDELGSFGSWLIDKYGLLNVLETWRTNDFSGTLGKDYETLKGEWQKFVDPYMELAVK